MRLCGRVRAALRPIDSRGQPRSLRTFEDEKVVPLGNILHVLRTYIWLILFVMLLGVGIALGYSFLQTPQYEASTKILVGQNSESIEEAGSGESGEQLQGLTETMSEAIRTRLVAEEVIRQNGLTLNPDALLDRIVATQVGTTQFIQVSYTDSDPQTAQLVANAVAQVFSERVFEVSPDVNAVTATVWEEAVVRGQVMSPNIIRNVAGGLTVGVLLGLGLAFLLNYLDNNNRKKSER
jgi:capsular polysaccharide biosynthesis protein